MLENKKPHWPSLSPCPLWALLHLGIRTEEREGDDRADPSTADFSPPLMGIFKKYHHPLKRPKETELAGKLHHLVLKAIKVLKVRVQSSGCFLKTTAISGHSPD